MGNTREAANQTCAPLDGQEPERARLTLARRFMLITGNVRQTRAIGERLSG
jgi:hypothetical protein